MNKASTDSNEHARPGAWTFLLFPASVVFVLSPVALVINNLWGLPLPFDPRPGFISIAIQLLAMGSPLYFAGLAIYWWASRHRMRMALALAAIGMWVVASALTFFAMLSCFSGCGELVPVIVLALYPAALVGLSWFAHLPPSPDDTDEGPTREPA